MIKLETGTFIRADEITAIRVMVGAKPGDICFMSAPLPPRVAVDHGRGHVEIINFSTHSEAKAHADTLALRVKKVLDNA